VCEKWTLTLLRFSSVANVPVLAGNFPVILRLGDDPKFVAVHDAEVAGDSIAEAVPVLGNRVFQEFQNCSLEAKQSGLLR
jgi:hypothetical protein